MINKYFDDLFSPQNLNRTFHDCYLSEIKFKIKTYFCVIITYYEDNDDSINIIKLKLVIKILDSLDFNPKQAGGSESMFGAAP